MMPDADVDHCDDDNEISSLGAREIDNKRAKVKSTKPFDVCVCQITFSEPNPSFKTEKKLQKWFSSKLDSVFVRFYPFFCVSVWFTFIPCILFTSRYNLTVIWTHCTCLHLSIQKKWTFKNKMRLFRSEILQKNYSKKFVYIFHESGNSLLKI